MELDLHLKDLVQEARATVKQIRDQVKMVINLKDFCREARSIKGAALAGDVAGPSRLCEWLAAESCLVAKRLLLDDPEVLLDMIKVISRKLFDAPGLQLSHINLQSCSHSSCPSHDSFSFLKTKDN